LAVGYGTTGPAQRLHAIDAVADEIAPRSGACSQRWEFRWRTPGPGSYTLRARATDVTGATQPATVTRNTFGYHFGGIAGHPASTV